MSRKQSDSTRTLTRSDRDRVVHLQSFRLLFLAGKDKGQTFEWEGEVCRMGSIPGCDLVLNDDSVSRHHCEIWRHEKGYKIRDLDSTNGSYVNGIQIKEAHLDGGEVIRLGESEMRFQPDLEELELIPSDKSQFGHLIGQTPAMRRLYTLLERVSPSEITVIIEGETGTGKELVARSIHEHSKRAKGPFMTVDCGSVSENLVQSELFGHEKGAYTGADQARAGAFEACRGGTIFLDEIGELNLDLQPQLLRVIEQREVKRLGSNNSTTIDVRVIAATNRDLEKEVAAGRFRQDLFFRLAVVRVMMPPLRDRRDDIPLLVDKFLATQKRILGISPAAMSILKSSEWSGNVRELRNVLERALALGEGPLLEPRDLLLPPQTSDPANMASLAGKTLEEVESVAILETLRSCDWNKSQAAKTLGIAYSTLHEKIKKYNLKP